MPRAKVLVRAKQRDREALVGLTSEGLSQHVIQIGQNMSRDARDAARERASAATGRSRSSAVALREMEARRIAYERAELMIVCDEMRKRIDTLLAGGEIGEV